MPPFASDCPTKREEVCFNELYSKCLHKLMWINGYEISIEEENLSCLDLAIHTTDSGRTLDKSIKIQILRNLPPSVAEYLTPETAFLEPNTLSSLFLVFLDHFKEVQTLTKEFRRIVAREIHTQYENRFLKLIRGRGSKTAKRKALLAYLKTVRVFGLIDEDHYVEVFHVLLEVASDEFPKDSKLVLTMLDSLCASNYSKMSVFSDVGGVKPLRFLLRHALHSGFDFWGLWRGVGPISSEFNPVAVFFRSPDRRVMIKTLLTYGFQYKSEAVIYRCRCFSIFHLRYHGLRIMNNVGFTRLLVRRSDRMLLVLDTFLTFSGLDPPDDPHNIKDLVLISRSLPHPYLTPRHLFNNLSDVFQPTFHKQLAMICQNYASRKVFDQDYRTYAPRTLKHLCRCAVRKALMDNLMLPDGIGDLGLKHDLKAYLKLKC